MARYLGSDMVRGIGPKLAERIVGQFGLWASLSPPLPGFLQKDQEAMRKIISSGSPFETEIGYSRAIVDGEWIFVSGTTGFDYEAMTISPDVRDQAEQTMRNIGRALTEAGSSYADVVRVRYILPNAADFEPCWPVLRRYFGEVRPAATMIAAGLSDPRMKIEIEVTAQGCRAGR